MAALPPLQQIGLLVAAFAVVCLYFGIVWSFDNGLLMLGNAALLASFGLILGPWSVLMLFVGGARGVLPFLLGMALVFYNFRFLGILIELYGACLLVMAALPQWLSRAKQLPYVGWMLPAVFPSAFKAAHQRRRGRHSSAGREVAESDSDDNGSTAMRCSDGGRNGGAQLAHGTQVDGNWRDYKAEYDADEEIERKARVTGNRQHVKLGAIGRRSTVV